MKRLFTLVLTLAAMTASAEGYQVNTQSAKQLGMGHTGTGLKLGAEGMHFNPATLVYMNSAFEVSVGASMVNSKIKAKLDSGVGQPGTSVTAYSDNKASTPMYGYIGMTLIKDKLAAGVSVTNPYGSSMNWGDNWVGSTIIQNIKLKTFVYQPTISWAVCENLSVGAGLMIATGDFEMSKGIIPASTTNNINLVSANMAGDAKVAIGANIGLYYQASSKFSIGVSYRTKMKMTANDGKTKFNFYNEGAKDMFLASNEGQAAMMLTKTSFSATLPLPSNFTIGLGYKLNDCWLFAADFQYVGWAAYNKLELNYKPFIPAAGAPEMDIPSQVQWKHYTNTMAFRLGAQYTPTTKLALRFGAYYDQTPTRDYNYNPETPGANKLGLTCGLTWSPARWVDLNVAFNYVRGFSRTGYVTHVTPGSDLFGGKYSSNAYIPSFGLGFKF